MSKHAYQDSKVAKWIKWAMENGEIPLGYNTERDFVPIISDISEHLHKMSGLQAAALTEYANTHNVYRKGLELTLIKIEELRKEKFKHFQASEQPVKPEQAVTPTPTEKFCR